MRTTISWTTLLWYLDGTRHYTHFIDPLHLKTIIHFTIELLMTDMNVNSISYDAFVKELCSSSHSVMKFNSYQHPAIGLPLWYIRSRRVGRGCKVATTPHFVRYFKREIDNCRLIICIVDTLHVFIRTVCKIWVWLGMSKVNYIYSFVRWPSLFICIFNK
jgi:hypothetical protein